jgi:23S rRNA pseudouridine2605 synthase
MATEHLNRYLSLAASVSRRVADEMVRKGRVTVDGVKVLDPGMLWNPSTQEVRLDDRTLVPIQEEKIYIMLYKPDNVMTTMKDREGRKTAPSLIGELSSRVFPVGRLDFHTTGLLLLTNDGEFAYRLTHPSFGVEKTYIAKLQSVPRPAELGVLRRGVAIDGKMTTPAQVSFIEKKADKAWVTMRIAEGRYHQVRKMFEAVGHRVTKLRRVAIGPLELSGIEPGEWRYLTSKEVREMNSYMDRREVEVAGQKKPADVPHHPKRIETFADRGKRKVIKESINEAARKKEIDREKAAAEARAAERKGPRQPKPAWKKGAKHAGKKTTRKPYEKKAAPKPTGKKAAAKPSGPSGKKSFSKPYEKSSTRKPYEKKASPKASPKPTGKNSSPKLYEKNVKKSPSKSSGKKSPPRFGGGAKKR